MRVASFPGGEDALNLGRVPSTSAERARFPIGEGASPVDVAASAANGEPVSPSSRNQKKHLQHSESMAFDMLFDSMDGGAPDMEDIEEGEEDYGDSDQDAHDPVSVYVRYATIRDPPARRLSRRRLFSFAPRAATRPTRLFATAEPPKSASRVQWPIAIQKIQKISDGGVWFFLFVCKSRVC
jgi:hypothetical protein